MPELSFRRRSPGLRPRLPWLFPTSRAMVRETAMGKYCNLPIGPDRRQWTTGGARRQSSAYGKGAYSFLSKPWVFPSCENEKRIPCSVMLSRRSPPGRVAPAAKRRRGPSALLATRAKMPPSSRTMPRSSQSTLISATPSTPTETRFDSASRSSSTVLPHHDIPANLPATVVSTATDGTSARTHFRASGVGKAERSALGAKTSPAKMEATRSRRFQRAKA
ncbi:hypothetical protein Q027_00721 [Pseudomonas aeruginosa BWHPSA014]|nr:hypothetical protein Q034_03030 [Pseudomonas aeruginosa BWHPSA021]ERW34962.1 hypothetical protein Q033_04055 [Pseudomonas aeruginosa BWHPSA020]ERW55840.1 hypothetical protein Q027_00721 [Pseudomonas aeruginosa BWHPSA014]ERW62800.1 hypothetical protein Q025_03764 [Pseudomonas aeruginosa BWHPSA012]ERW94581.1 hypothetical protein Q017_03025 [Pseudomonas aeruginosa BWHPSA004]ETV38303.1 hypothetical protein Q045_03706 [Pseudomonas aeruginosa BWHPSA040]EZP22805.1 hypothetical protein V550_02651 